MSLSRRRLFRASTGFLGLTLAPRSLFASASSKEARRLVEEQNQVFAYGVASGDPLADRVILWTQVGTDKDVETVYWQVALDPYFRDVVSEGLCEAKVEHDHCVKVDAILPLPATTYYYRFQALGFWSMVGRTRTAPRNSENIRVAVVSCSSIWSGYFNAYEKLSKRDDIDLIIHCGDYVYEAPDPDETRNMPQNSLDKSCPGTLDEHRRRFRYYRLDRYLRRAHQQHPWAIVWDNHDLGTVGSVADAIRAFREWTPIRDPRPGEDEYIYRTLDYGSLLKIVLLDTRHIGRGSRIAGSKDLSILGDEQFQWLSNEMQNSSARWNLVVNQVLLAPFEAFGKTLASDAWGGYPKDRQRVLRLFADLPNRNTIVVSGDAHLSYGCSLESDGRPAGVEFLPTSVSRGNLDETIHGFIGKVASTLAPGLVKTFNPHIKYFEASQHGYGIVDIRAGVSRCEYWYCPIEEQSDQEKLGKSLQVLDGNGRISFQDNNQTFAIGSRGIQAPQEQLLYMRGEELGGLKGQSFDAMEFLPKEARLSELKLLCGDRIDRISWTYSDGTQQSFGGDGGHERSLVLAEGEYLRSMIIGVGKRGGSNRVFFLQLKTSKGQILEGGKKTPNSIEMTAPEGHHIIGFYGRSGSELDKIGPIFAVDF